MSMAVLLAMFTFSLVMSISPGPVNMISVSTGATYGAWRAFRFVSGATVGFTMLLVVSAFGLATLVTNHAGVLDALSVAGFAFMMYLGGKIMLATPDLDTERDAVPRFADGFMLQWLNPKAWMACVSGVSLFTGAAGASRLTIFVVMYFFVCYVSLFAWALLGGALSGVLAGRAARLRVFNAVMGGLLMVTACYLLYERFVLG